ncbi:MAG: hypothetical protein V2I45_01150 [Halieaceae bacterium]|nr:hypothetical protein [Halieaceae bacterium]
MENTLQLERGWEPRLRIALDSAIDPTASLLVWREGHQGRALDWFIERLSL